MLGGRGLVGRTPFEEMPSPIATVIVLATGARARGGPALGAEGEATVIGPAHAPAVLLDSLNSKILVKRSSSQTFGTTFCANVCTR